MTTTLFWYLILHGWNVWPEVHHATTGPWVEWLCRRASSNATSGPWIARWW